jgi:hypothetical protein
MNFRGFCQSDEIVSKPQHVSRRNRIADIAEGVRSLFGIPVLLEQLQNLTHDRGKQVRGVASLGRNLQ